MTISKAERSKINKRNRKLGYRAEYDSVLLLRGLGYWVMRLRSRQQRGEMAPVDGYYWDPARKVFGFFTTKVRKELITKTEIQLMKFLGKKWECEILFFWREKGMKFEVISP